MKKTLSFLLALLMIFTIVSCAKDPVAPATTPPPPADSAAPGGSVPTDAPPAADGSIGYVTDDVDHGARRTYNIVYMNYAPSNLTQQIEDALNQLGAVYNFTTENLTANADSDAYVNNLNTALIKEPDGVLIDAPQEFAPRIAELVREYDIPSVALFNKMVDVEGHCLIPGVLMDQYYNGQRQLEYLDSSYKEFWGDIDRSEIVFLALDFSSGMDVTLRAQGALEKFQELYPGNTTYNADSAALNMSPESGYDITNSIISAHPEVKYWFIVSVVEDLALGASRAIDALGKTDRVIMTASGAAILPGEWDNGYDGCWIANYAVSPFLYSGTAMFGLLALIDGRAARETLWPEYFLNGDEAARFMLKADMMTHANYKQYLGDIVRSFGVEFKG